MQTQWVNEYFMVTTTGNIQINNSIITQWIFGLIYNALLVHYIRNTQKTYNHIETFVLFIHVIVNISHRLVSIR